MLSSPRRVGDRTVCTGIMWHASRGMPCLNLHRLSPLETWQRFCWVGFLGQETHLCNDKHCGRDISIPFPACAVSVTAFWALGMMCSIWERSYKSSRRLWNMSLNSYTLKGWDERVHKYLVIGSKSLNSQTRFFLFLFSNLTKALRIHSASKWVTIWMLVERHFREVIVCM